MPEGPSGRVQPRTVKGFRDILPHQVVARRRMIDTIRAAFERYGFVPLDTPALEYVDALLGLGEEGVKNLFRMKTPEGEEVALRYDLTVPLARVVSQYPNLPRPFRRYQVSPVWRADKPDPGRFREFIQFDIDSVGSPSVLADAEILMAMDQALRDLKVDFVIRYSSRKLLDLLLRHAAIPQGQGPATLRILDKLDKQGLDAVISELGQGRRDASGDEIPGLGLPTQTIQRIAGFLNAASQARDAVVPRARSSYTRERIIGDLSYYFRNVEDHEEAIDELTQVDRFLTAAGIPCERAFVDPSIARGLDYYTGPIFEATLRELPRLGAVFGGGRYDGLVERFLGTKVPATGASIGVDRLLSAITELQPEKPVLATARVLTTVMDQGRIADYLAITREVREAGIPAEIYMGEAAGLKRQIAYADKVGIPVVIIAGSNEFDAGTVSIKDLREGKQHEGDAASRDAWVKQRFGQKTVPRGEMIATIRSLVGSP